MTRSVLPAGAALCEDGLWRQILRRPHGTAPCPALFLDRDGVVVEEVGHLRRAADVRLIPGAARTIAAANRAGILVVIVSNQSGIGRGLFDWADFEAVQAHLLDDLGRDGAVVDAVFACPHHADAKAPYTHPDHPARKPNPGMLLAAAAMLPIRLAGSYIVGDRASDLAAGRSAGLAGGLYVRSGPDIGVGNETMAVQALAGRLYRVFVAASIAAAPDLLPIFGRTAPAAGPPRAAEDAGGERADGDDVPAGEPPDGDPGAQPRP
jgi:D-glycero-D-manno-heptose 1,7-bisphosphate phosphatase